MKKMFGVLAILLALLLASCQVPFSGLGSIKISLPNTARTVNAGDGKGNIVRIQLVQNGINLVPLSTSTSYLQAPLAGQDIEITDLNPGSNYTLLVATGEIKTSGFFEVSYFNTSEPFDIIAGESQDVPVTLNKNTGRSLLTHSASATQAVTTVGSSLYYLDNGSLTSRTSIGETSGSTVANLDGKNVRSLSTAGTEAWINTDSGIFRSASSGALGPVSGADTFNAYDSGRVTINNISSSVTSATISYYTGKGTVGGVKLDINNGAGGKWVEFSTALGSSLAKYSNSQLLSGIASTDKFAYLATAVGLMRVNTDLIKEASADRDPSTYLTNKLANGDFEVSYNPEAKVSSVSTYSNGTKAFVFVASDKGLYGANVNASTGVSTGDLPALADTEGQMFGKVSTATSANEDATVYTAAYNVSTRSVMVFKDLNLVRIIPAFNGLPNGNLSFAWLGANNLVIVGDASGPNATVAINLN